MGTADVSKTTKDSRSFKREVLSDPLLRKGGPMKEDTMVVIPCRICNGLTKNPANGEECARCEGTGEEYVDDKYY